MSHTMIMILGAIIAVLIILFLITKITERHDAGKRWKAQYEQMMAFMEENHRRPSKYKLEEHDMLNWFKSNKKMMNKGTFPEERLERFNKLLKLAEKYRRLNQHDIKD